MTIALSIDGAVRAVCPIHGVSIGRKHDKTTWRIDFKDEATEQQRAAARAALEAFDPAAPKIEAVETIARIELENPITHRADREKALTDDHIMRALRSKINALDAEVATLAGRAAAPLPEIPLSHGLRAVKTVDDAIRAERAKL